MSTTSTNTNNTNPPGLMLPTQKSYTTGAGNPRDSAMMSIQNMNNKQANLNASVGGGKRRKFRGGAEVQVPQMQMLYQPQGGLGSNPNDQIKANSSTSMQSIAWSAKDNEATKVGGSRRRLRKSLKRSLKRSNYKGGSSNLNWGCYSGGYRKTYRKSRKNHRKKSKHYSHQ
jgi:hypothetical protein